MRCGRWLGVLLVSCFAGRMAGQGVEALPAVDLARWDIPPGNYSGITPLGNDRYAVVSDKAARDGFFVFRIVQDTLTGQVTEVYNEGFRGQPAQTAGGRDAEGVAFVPDDSLVWVSGEADQRVVAYRMDGAPAGRELAVPEHMGRQAIVPNYGFEALGYDRETGLFWTLTENALKDDAPVAEPGVEDTVCLRLQSFDREGLPSAQYAYPLDRPQTEVRGRRYAFGAVALWPGGDGRLWVMEREVNVPKRRLRSRSGVKIYEVRPRPEDALPGQAVADEMRRRALPKRLLASFSTRMRLFRPPLANYEGLCAGRRLADGRRTLLLVSDSQDRQGNRMCHLRDWIRVLVLPEKEEGR